MKSATKTRAEAEAAFATRKRKLELVQVAERALTDATHKLRKALDALCVATTPCSVCMMPEGAPCLMDATGPHRARWKTFQAAEAKRVAGRTE